MKIAHYIFVVLLIAAISSCKKVELEPSTPSSNPSPVFSASVIVDGEVSTMNAGENVNLNTYHDFIGASSYFGSSFTDQAGNDMLSFEFGLLTPLTENSFNGPVDFGSLECYFELDASNIQTNTAFDIYVWDVNGITYTNTNAPITEYGVYDVTFFALLIDGTQLLLQDRITIGGLEVHEPEIAIVEISPTQFLCTPVNYTNGYDEVVWEIALQSGAVITSNDVNFTADVPLSTENFVVKCSYYADGNLLNYSSIMFASSIFPSAPFVDINGSINSIELPALPLTTRGKVSYSYNGDIYTTKDSYPPSFQVSSLNTFMDEYTADTYLKGPLTFESYLYNTSGDSIYVEIESEIGFADMPD